MRTAHGARQFVLMLLLGHGLAVDAQDAGWFRFMYDNDFFNATDRYYTQGIDLELAAPFVDRSPLRHVLLRFGEGATQRQVLYARQECFTPSSIRRDTILRTDRPFAAALFIGQRSISTETVKKRRWMTAISLGVLGPCAFCAEEQVGIHRALDNIAPLGWEYQVAGDVLVNYSTTFDQRLFKGRSAEISGGLGAEAGTYRSNANVHARLEAGRFNSGFDIPTFSARPFRASAFISGEIRGIVHDATYQGGFFSRDSPHTLSASSLERIVLRGEAGVRLSFHGLALVYSKTWITREFDQGMEHGWGSCVITVLF